MVLKEDIDDAKQRLDAWWDHEIIDRPVVSYYFPIKRGKTWGYLDLWGEVWDLAENFDGIELSLEGFEERAKRTFFGGESIPSYFPNYGPGIVAAVFGVEPKMGERTVWFSRPTKPEEIVALLESVKLNQNNEWYNRLLRITEYAAKRANGDYHISLTDLGGVLDILSSFLGPTNILLTMKRQPSLIDTCREIILEKLLKIYDKLQDIIEMHCEGCNTWLNIWCRKRYYPVQCDFIAMLNPKWFRRFALPDILSQAEHMDYMLYHMDGPNQIPFLDDFLSSPYITGIQWVPGAGKSPPGSDEWMPLYKKIQKAGKNVELTTLANKVPHMFKKLNPKGLFVRTYFQSNFIANIYLPKSHGGKGGKIVFDAVDWLKENKKEKMIKQELETFLSENEIELNGKEKRDLLKEINNTMIEKLFYA